MLVQQTTEGIVEVWRLIFQERIRQRTVEEIMDVLVPHIQKEMTRNHLSLQKNIDTHNMNHTVSSLSPRGPRFRQRCSERCDGHCPDPVDTRYAVSNAAHNFALLRRSLEDQLTQDNKTGKTPQTQHLDTMVDVPVAMQQLVP